MEAVTNRRNRRIRISSKRGNKSPNFITFDGYGVYDVDDYEYVTYDETAATTTNLDADNNQPNHRQSQTPTKSTGHTRNEKNCLSFSLCL